MPCTLDPGKHKGSLLIICKVSLHWLVTLFRGFREIADMVELDNNGPSDSVAHLVFAWCKEQHDKERTCRQTDLGLSRLAFLL